ncbi:hypothetical protein FQN49_008611, partial [Arthroderma sp. PD_2]
LQVLPLGDGQGMASLPIRYMSSPRSLLNRYPTNNSLRRRYKDLCYRIRRLRERRSSGWGSGWPSTARTTTIRVPTRRRC